MFLLQSGPARTEWFPKVASTAIANGAALTFDGSGAVTVATATSTRIAGISAKVIASTDSDYASNTLIPLVAVGPDDIFLAAVGTGTLTTAMVGNQYDLADSVGIDVTATSHKQVTVVGFVSASLALVKFNANYVYVNAA